MKSALKAVIGLALAVILIAGGFIGGFVMAKAAPSSVLTAAPSGAKDLNARIDEVRKLLEEQALEPPSESSATAGAIRGLVTSNGDKYGEYFDKKHFEYFSQEMSGEFGGIGVTLGEKDGSAYVVNVIEGTPAQKAKLKTGDRFAAIDGIRRDKWVVEEVVKRVRGERGTTVKLTMLRPGKDGADDKEFTVTLTRATITFPNTTSKLKGEVGYIRTAQFNDNATREIKDAVIKLEKKGAKSFVLDLRDNPGGQLDQAIDVSSLFIKSGVIVRVDERGKPEAEHRATGMQVTDAPLVLLINGNSASASEIVAGALQDYGRATLVGEKSFGKGSVQTIKPLSFGGAVKFTIAHYLTPKKRIINGKGVTPDVVVKMDIEKQMSDKTDSQLQRALKEAEKLAR